MNATRERGATLKLTVTKFFAQTDTQTFDTIQETRKQFHNVRFSSAGQSHGRCQTRNAWRNRARELLKRATRCVALSAARGMEGEKNEKEREGMRKNRAGIQEFLSST